MKFKKAIQDNFGRGFKLDNSLRPQIQKLIDEILKGRKTKSLRMTLRQLL